jgi:hypothetical protein
MIDETKKFEGDGTVHLGLRRPQWSFSVSRDLHLVFRRYYPYEPRRPCHPVHHVSLSASAEDSLNTQSSGPIYKINPSQ